MRNIPSLIGVILLLPSCSDLNEKVGVPDDNIVEEIIEFIIEDNTGVDVDLTPEQ